MDERDDLSDSDRLSIEGEYVSDECALWKSGLACIKIKSEEAE